MTPPVTYDNHPPAPAPATNGLATAGLVLGILPTGIIGLVFSVLGIIRAGKLGGTGRGRAWIGAVLSVLWLAGSIALVSTAGGTVAKRLNPGCVAAETFVPNWESSVQADSADPAALKTDLQQAVTELTADAGKSTNATAAAAMRKLAGDVKELANDLATGTAPSDDLQNRLDADGTAIDTACGH
jgi:hypothetical protein